MRWNMAHVLKLFLPSWNFFDDFDAVPRLEARWAREPSGAGDCWVPVFPCSTTTGWVRAFYNPWGNLELLERSQVERAVEELAELAGPTPQEPRPHRAEDEKAHRAEAARRFAASETFGILTRLARRRLRAGAECLWAGGSEVATDAQVEVRIVLAIPGRPLQVWFESSEVAGTARAGLVQPAGDLP
jgi:hypothetical protein